MKHTVVVNGEPRQVDEGTTILGLLEALQIRSGQVAVEVNSQIVRRTNHRDHRLSPGDKVEIVTFVGGG